MVMLLHEFEGHRAYLRLGRQVRSPPRALELLDSLTQKGSRRSGAPLGRSRYPRY